MDGDGPTFRIGDVIALMTHGRDDPTWRWRRAARPYEGGQTAGNLQGVRTTVEEEQVYCGPEASITVKGTTITGNAFSVVLQNGATYDGADNDIRDNDLDDVQQDGHLYVEMEVLLPVTAADIIP